MVLVKHKNKLFETLKSQGLDPKDFHWEDTTYEYRNFKYDTFKIILGNKDFFFMVCQSEDSFNKFFAIKSLFEPKHPIVKINIDRRIMAIDDIVESFIVWINKEVKQYFTEINSKDYWTLYRDQVQQLEYDQINFEDDSKFSEKEKIHIRKSLGEFRKRMVKDFDFNSDQINEIDRRVRYLELALDRLNRTDWKGIAISTIIGLILNLTVDTQTGQSIIELFKRIFEGLPRLPF